MNAVSNSLKFLLNVSKFQSILARKLDGCLGGLGFSEFIILYALSQAPEQKLRRVDLADKIGLTASGVTRLLVPMEKIGLVKRDLNENDARVRYVMLSPGGRNKLIEALERAELFVSENIPAGKAARITKFNDLITEFNQIFK